MSNNYTHKDKHKLVKYYTHQKTGKISSRDLSLANTPQQIDKSCEHVYVSGNPHGYYWDLNEKPIGNRPVWKSYHVGDLTKVSAPPALRKVDYGCRGPYWCPNCQ
jgi:hypothetical protein